MADHTVIGRTTPSLFETETSQAFILFVFQVLPHFGRVAAQLHDGPLIHAKSRSCLVKDITSLDVTVRGGRVDDVNLVHRHFGLCHV